MIDQRELEKLKVQVETEFVGGNARVAGIAESLASAHVFLGSTQQVNAEIDRYLAVTAEDLQRAARTYFVKENRVVLHYLPMERSSN
jgi:predicted Zn-dependent peptidase